MTLSEKVKSIFDIVRAIASYIAIVAFAFIITFKGKIEDTNWSKISSITEVVLYLLAIILVTLPLFLYFYEDIKLRWVIYRGNLKQFVIEKSETVIDIYHKDGKYADVYQKVFFHRVSNNTKEQYVNSIDISTGQIIASSVQTLNCYQSLNHEKNKISISYTNKMEKLNKVKNLFKKNDKFLMYYMTLKNAFPNIKTEEYWSMSVTNLCQDYYLEIVLPAHSRVRYAKFTRNNTQDIVQDIQPMIIKHGDRMKIILRVMNFDRSETFKLVWSLI